MANQLSPRVRQYRDALRAKREAQDPTRISNGPDPFLTPSDPNFVVPLTRDSQVRPAPNNGQAGDAWLDKDVHMNPEDDPRQTSSLHEFLDNGLDEATLLEAAEDAIRSNN